MITSKRIRIFVSGIVLAAAQIGIAGAADAEPGKVIVALYHAAPGKQLDLLKWLAAREAVDKEASVPASQVYAHTDGDSWDYLVVSPQLSEADSAKVDQIAKKKGLKTGFA